MSDSLRRPRQRLSDNRLTGSCIAALVPARRPPGCGGAAGVRDWTQPAISFKILTRICTRRLRRACRS